MTAGADRHLSPAISMKRVRLSDRGTSQGVNAISRARAELVANGARIYDLSDSNPTRHGLLHPGVLPAVGRHVDGAARYDPLPRGPVPARQTLAAIYGGSPDDYYLASSTSQLYAWLVTLFADPGEAVAVPSPGYPLIPPIAQLTGARTVDYRFHYAHPHGWILDGRSVIAALGADGVRAVVVVNPGNPTGAYLDAGGEALVEACAVRGLPLISDEVFGPFALDSMTSMTTSMTNDRALAGDVPRVPPTLAGESRVVTVTLGGLSKLLCAPQLKLAWARLAGPAAELAVVREGLDSIADMFLPVSGPIAAALPELMALADESVTATRTRLTANLAALREVFGGGPYRVRRCEGGWTALLDVPRYLPSQELVIHLLREAHLAVHPGWFYDLPSEGTLALSLLPSPEEFRSGMARLRSALDALGS